jgi:membrane protease YdiL (CAAX protease family)
MLNASSKHQVAPDVGSDKRWPGVFGSIIATAAVFILGSGIGVLIISLLTTVAGGSSKEGNTLFGSTVLMQFAYAVAVYGVMTMILVWFLRMRRLKLADLGLTKTPRISDLGWALIAFAAYVSVYTLLLTVIKPFVPGLDVDQKQDIGFDGASGLSLVLVYFALAIVAPVAEEILMRGFLFTSLRRRMNFVITALITSAVFASLHLTGGESGAGLLWIAAFDTFVLSFVLCYLREKTGKLWAGIAVHMIKNTVAFVALFVVGASG